MLFYDIRGSGGFTPDPLIIMRACRLWKGSVAGEEVEIGSGLTLKST